MNRRGNLKLLTASIALGLGLGDDWVGEFSAYGDEPDPKGLTGILLGCLAFSIVMDTCEADLRLKYESLLGLLDERSRRLVLGAEARHMQV